MKISIIAPENFGLVHKVLDCPYLKDVSRAAAANTWSPILFKGSHRRESEFQSTDLLVLDVDEGLAIDQAAAKLREAELAHVIMESRNHRKEKNGKVEDRYRVIVPLMEPITNLDDYKATIDAFKGWFGAGDSQCLDGARMFFKSPRLAFSGEGKGYLTVKYVPLQEEPITKPKEAPMGEKGKLWRSTLEFLQEGAPAGSRHRALVQAVGNMREQGYDQTETEAMIEAMSRNGVSSWTQEGLNEDDIRTIDRMYKREAKYEFTPKEEKAKEETEAYVRASDLLEESFSYLSDKDRVKGDPTGVEGLDKLLGGGFRTGELTVLMAAAKTGKNTLYHYLIHSMLTRGLAVAYASRELTPATEVVPNLLTISLKQNLWTADLTNEVREAAATEIGKWSLFFAPGYGYFPPEDIEKWFRAMRDLGIKHFVFDHLHYALLGEDYESTAALIKKLKSLCKELDVHLNLIVQPRSLREGERLSLATLRGGAAIGQALDNLLILERTRDGENVSKLTLEVARHKLCKLGSIYLRYDPTTTAFEEVDRIQMQEEETEDLQRRLSYRVN